MKLSKTDLGVTGILLFIIFLFLWLTFKHFNQRITQLSATAAIGTVSYKYNTVKRKFLDRFIWENIGSSTNVYLNDSILTGERSDAVVQLKSGLKIELDPNSLIQLNLIKDSIGLKLEKGVIRAKGETKGNSTFVRTSSGLLADITDSDVTLSENKGSSGIFVKSGSVSVYGEETVTSGKVLRRGKDGKWSLREIHIVELNPKDGALILTKKLKENITFKWNTVKKIKEYDLYLSKDSTMKNKMTVHSKKITITLDEGVWYWQIRSHKNPEEFFSNVQSLNIQNLKPLEILSPSDNTLLVSKPHDNILFRWKQPEKSSSVRFSLSSDKKFKKMLKEEILISPSIIVKGLGKGKYYWKVQPEFGGKAAERVEGPSKDKNDDVNGANNNVIQKHVFIIDDTHRPIESPKNLKPSSNLVISAGINKNMRFSWNTVNSTDVYELEIYLDGEKKPVVKKTISTNFYNLEIPWKTKEILWKVRSTRRLKERNLVQNSKISVAKLNVSFSIPAPPEIISAHSKIIY